MQRDHIQPSCIAHLRYMLKLVEDGNAWDVWEDAGLIRFSVMNQDNVDNAEEPLMEEISIREAYHA